MKTTSLRKARAIVLVGSLLLALGGCQCTFGKLDGKCHGDNDDGDDGKRIRLHPIYEAVLIGALVGLIVGHQSDEDCNGTAIGAGIGGIGAILAAIDRQADQLEKSKETEKAVTVVELTNSNGAARYVILRKHNRGYLGPAGEYYKNLPREDELASVYGL